MVIDYNLDKVTNLTRPLTPFLITSYSKKYGDDVAPISSVGFLSYNPPRNIIAIHPKRNTYKNLKETGECVLNVPAVDLLEAIFKAGKKVSPDFNKFKAYGFTKEQSKIVKPVRIKECIAWVEYKIIEELFPKESERTLFVLKPVTASVRKEVMQGERYSPEKAKIPVHLSGNVFSVAERTLLVYKKEVMSWKEYMDYISKEDVSQ
ncbi:MAG: flavin reductase family protein [Candidatus Berkelbacteria bacterium]|nr:flavin reductase family protein [Candidatus Berkelbacteria bacterium]